MICSRLRYPAPRLPPAKGQPGMPAHGAASRRCWDVVVSPAGTGAGREFVVVLRRRTQRCAGYRSRRSVVVHRPQLRSLPPLAPPDAVADRGSSRLGRYTRRHPLTSRRQPAARVGRCLVRSNRRGPPASCA